MTKQILEAFIEQIKEQYWNNVNIGVSSSQADFVRRETALAVGMVAQRFNKRFKWEKFNKACEV